MNLFAELRRRNVIRVAGLYLVAGWLVVQVAETVLPVFDTPSWVLKALIVLLALGFIPMLVFSWAFELTPGGLKREREVDRAAPGIDRTARKLDIAVIALLFAVGGLMLWQSTRAPVTAPDASIVDATPAPTTPGAAPAAIDPSGPPAPPAASIAVLPFVNMSADAENGFFADGISEELLNVLARIDGLTVASRTSSFSFKGKDVPIPEIAEALGVRHVLEGSVRKQGQRVRITAQLIRAGTDSHLWSQTWDRDLTDIFDVQQEIAQAIADEMTNVLPVAGKVEVPVATRDMAAYESFLRGRSRFFQRTDLAGALDDLKDAVARDPDLDEAWVFLAATHFVIPGYDPAFQEEASYAAADAAIAEARRRLPDHPMVAALIGALASERGDVLGGLDAVERAAAQPSTDSTPTMWHGMSLLRAGYVKEAAEVLDRGRRIDPMVGITTGYHAIAQLCVDGDIEAAHQRALRAAELGWDAAIYLVAIERAARGDEAGARAALAPIDLSDKFFASEIVTFEKALAAPASAHAIFSRHSDDLLPEGALAFGAHDVLLERLSSRLDQGRVAGSVSFLMRGFWLPSMRAAREDPRLYEFARRAGYVALWEARGWPDGCRRVQDTGVPRLECDRPEGTP